MGHVLLGPARSACASAGSAAGASAVAVTYPLDLVRTRLAYSIRPQPPHGAASGTAASGGGQGPHAAARQPTDAGRPGSAPHVSTSLSASARSAQGCSTSGSSSAPSSAGPGQGAAGGNAARGLHGTPPRRSSSLASAQRSSPGVRQRSWPGLFNHRYAALRCSCLQTSCWAAAAAAAAASCVLRRHICCRRWQGMLTVQSVKPCTGAAGLHSSAARLSASGSLAYQQHVTTISGEPSWGQRPDWLGLAWPPCQPLPRSAGSCTIRVL